VGSSLKIAPIMEGTRQAGGKVANRNPSAPTISEVSHTLEAAGPYQCCSAKQDLHVPVRNEGGHLSSLVELDNPIVMVGVPPLIDGHLSPTEAYQ
jgi:hypothetical protein